MIQLIGPSIGLKLSDPLILLGDQGILLRQIVQKLCDGRAVLRDAVLKEGNSSGSVHHVAS